MTVRWTNSARWLSVGKSLHVVSGGSGHAGGTKCDRDLRLFNLG